MPLCDSDTLDTRVVPFRRQTVSESLKNYVGRLGQNRGTRPFVTQGLD